jgi:hypothetical protein
VRAVRLAAQFQREVLHLVPGARDPRGPGRGPARGARRAAGLLAVARSVRGAGFVVAARSVRTVPAPAQARGPNSDPTGNTIFALAEVHESPAGVDAGGSRSRKAEPTRLHGVER